jgi:hypothetical protein
VNVRHSGVLTNTLQVSEGLSVVPAASIDFESLCAYDRHVFPAPRPEFLRACIQPPFTSVAVLRGGHLAGFAVLRKAESGFQVGPFVADDAVVAEALLCALRPAAGDQVVAVDVAMVNAEAAALAQRAGLSAKFETWRMYRGPVPVISNERLWGVSTLEIG